MYECVVVAYCPTALLQHFSSANSCEPQTSARARSCSQYLEIRGTGGAGGNRQIDIKLLK